MGRSSRPAFRVKAKRDDIAGRVFEAESFFIDSLEEWRKKMGLEKMTLVGHSLGGYLSVAYALRFPERVGKLVLLSPAGVPRDPNNTTMPSRELTDDQHADQEGAENGSTATLESLKQEQVVEKRKESKSRKVFTYLWEEGWSPFQIVRSSVFWGPMLIGKVCVPFPLPRVLCLQNPIDSIRLVDLERSARRRRATCTTTSHTSH